MDAKSYVANCDQTDVIVEIWDVEFVIENEIKMGLNQRQIAQTYALALRSSYPTDWAKVNQMILEKWPKGLERIKTMAWNGKCFDKPKSKKPEQ